MSVLSMRSLTWFQSSLVFTYGFALFLSAGLLFWIQPMIGKIMLPRLGGSPAVWNTCMVFFQVGLLLGYLYAHALTRIARTSLQVMIHLSLVALSGIYLFPFNFASDFSHSIMNEPVSWLLRELLTTIGLPFMLLSASSPLLQHWFARSHHHRAKDPYFLYVISNAGSLSALLLYPFLMDRLFSIDRQLQVYYQIFFILLFLLGVCACYLHYSMKTTCAGAIFSKNETKLSYTQRFYWVLLAFIPSSLLLSFTYKITTDLAAVPLLWVIPLVIYLFSFMLAFSRYMSMSKQALAATFISVFILSFTPFIQFAPNIVCIPFDWFFFAVCALLCHRELSLTRPHREHLTEFYLWIAFGGVLGGIFSGLLAFNLFTATYEHISVLMLLVWLIPWLSQNNHQPTGISMVGLLLTWLIVLGVMILCQNTIIIYVFTLLLPLCLLFWAPKNKDFVLVALMLVICPVASHYINKRIHDSRAGSVIAEYRNFFGTKRILYNAEKELFTLVHGTTIHGSQRSQSDRLERLGYYAEMGPLGDLVQRLDNRGKLTTMAVAGLGVGAIAAYHEQQRQIDFYEIDPDVIAIAQNSTWFTYLADCQQHCKTILGDFRTQLRQATDQSYDLIVLDAFSSDVIPTHLMTLEAVQLYQEKLTAGGALLFHISNRFLNLEPVLASVAHKLGLNAYAQVFRVSEAQKAQGIFGSHYVVMLASDNDFLAKARDSAWKRLDSAGPEFLWTDQFYNIVNVFHL